MKINGYQIREAIKRWMLQRDTFQSQFKDSLYVFEGDESKNSPQSLMADFTKADENVAMLESTQQQFNQIVKVNIQEKTLSLAMAVKLVGGAGRREKLWREAAVPKKDKYSYRSDEKTRDKDTEYAKPVISQSQAVQFSQNAGRFASALRNAIAIGNSQSVNIESLDLSEEEYKTLFE